MAKLRHNNVVMLYGGSTIPPRLAIVTECAHIAAASGFDYFARLCNNFHNNVNGGGGCSSSSSSSKNNNCINSKKKKKKNSIITTTTATAIIITTIIRLGDALWQVRAARQPVGHAAARAGRPLALALEPPPQVRR
jgi:hypothetical protein